jgi:endonuclease/exonuclease/phosphatase family metal-dependent hydrolase
MRPRSLFALTAVLAACSADRITGPSSPDVAVARSVTAPAGPLTVVSRNMYIGAPVEPILAETDPNLVPVRVAEAWAVLQATDFPTRAKAMADEIARTRPHLVGLQEVELIRSQFPSDIVVAPPAVPNPLPNATTVEFDFLTTLLAELAARGLEYEVAATVQDIDVEVPRFDGVVGGIPLFTDIRLTDRDVILARAGVAVANAASGNYAAMLPAPAGIQVPRGWTAVDATVGGVTYRFVNTHFESDAEIIRFLQAQELMAILAGETRPVVLVGDLNSGPGRPAEDGGQATYDFVLSNGFADAWDAHPRSGDGFTCCNAGDLSNLTPEFDQRIDLVLVRGDGILPLQVTIVGNQVNERRRFGVWPSDHAGVAASFVLAPTP